MILKQKIIVLLLNNCNFSAVMTCNINMQYAEYLIWDPKGVTAHKLRITGIEVIEV